MKEFQGQNQSIRVIVVWARASFGGLGKKRVKMNIGESDDGLGKFLGDLDSSFSEIVVSSSPPAAVKKVNDDKGYTSCIRIRGRPILPPIMSQVITMRKVVDISQYYLAMQY